MNEHARSGPDVGTLITARDTYIEFGLMKDRKYTYLGENGNEVTILSEYETIGDWITCAPRKCFDEFYLR